jgi:hypothetical protein
MFINSNYIDWELFLSALLSRSLSTSRSACFIYALYAHTHTNTVNWSCRRDACICVHIGTCMCVYEEARLETEIGEREKGWTIDRAGPARVRFLRLRIVQHTKNETDTKKQTNRLASIAPRSEHKARIPNTFCSNDFVIRLWSCRIASGLKLLSGFANGPGDTEAKPLEPDCWEGVTHRASVRWCAHPILSPSETPRDEQRNIWGAADFWWILMSNEFPDRAFA